MNRFVLPLLVLALSLAPLLCWAEEPNGDQAKVIAEIWKLGGKVAIDEKSPGKPVISVTLTGSKVTGRCVEASPWLSQLQSLNLGDTKVTDAGLGHLKGLSHLQSLDLHRMQLTDSGWSISKTYPTFNRWTCTELRSPTLGWGISKKLANLQTLNLGTTHVTDVGLATLKGLPKPPIAGSDQNQGHGRRAGPRQESVPTPLPEL